MTKPPHRISLRTRREDEYGCIEVQDNGPGMDEKVRKQVFEPFFTTKELGHGTGLGLYVSHGFVERHGGRLRIEERPGGGTRFCVDLPRVTSLVGG